jgi:dimethylamine/trimethylamine dehydrogenase
VDVHAGVEADAPLVKGHDADVIVVATGARYTPTGESGFRQTPIPGWQQPFVLAPEPVLRGERRLSGSVVVLDDEAMHTAAGVAEIAAGQGADVEFVTRHMIPALATGPTQVGYVMSRMLKAGITVSTSTYVREIGKQAVTLYNIMTGSERVVAADTVVLATMRTPITALADALDGTRAYIYVIGDALAPRSLREATYEGHRFARVIGEPDMPAKVTDAMFEPIKPLRAASLA